MAELKEVFIFCALYSGFVLYSVWSVFLTHAKVKTLISPPRSQD